MPEQAATFERLTRRGGAAVMAGDQQRDVPPVEGGRWGLQAVTFDHVDARMVPRSLGGGPC